jgi:hypothetical protein
MLCASDVVMALKGASCLPMRIGSPRVRNSKLFSLFEKSKGLSSVAIPARRAVHGRCGGVRPSEWLEE